MPSYLAALRYRVGGDALRFVSETHQEIPAEPPPERRTLVLFAHFDPQGRVDPYVVYYLQALHGLGATIVFVSGSPTLTPDSVAPIRSLCAGVYTRGTLSLDFGCWHLAWSILRNRGWSLEQFDRLVVTNDSVYGPLFSLDEMEFLRRRRHVRRHRKYCSAASTCNPSFSLGISIRGPARFSTTSGMASNTSSTRPISSESTRSACPSGRAKQA